MKKHSLFSLVAVIFLLSSSLYAFADDNKINLNSADTSNEYIKRAAIEVDYLHTTEDFGEFFNPYMSFFSLLPRSYDAVSENIVTEPKNQHGTGACWAFSTISAIETNMLKKGFGDIDTLDYSERHLAYFSHKKNELTGDGVDEVSSKYGYYDGGNPLTAAMHLAGWQGAELEENAPFKKLSEMTDLPEGQRYSSFSHLKSYSIIPEDITSVKEAIKKYGSVSALYFDNNLCYSPDNAYYQNKSNTVNHAITIVGWDDNYSLENFDGLSEKPQNKGAWKAKNSWGKHWGDDGYFWISYEEPSLIEFVAFDAQPITDYQRIYQYDGASFNKCLTLDKSANIFTAKEQESLSAVGFYTYFPASAISDSVPYIDYTIDIYKLSASYTTPESGELLLSQSDTISNNGYNTIDLDFPVSFNENDKFSVVLSLKYTHNPSNNAYHALEGKNNSSNKGESFIYVDSEWIDTKDYTDETLNNVCIKAYTNFENFTVTYNTNSESENSQISVPKYSKLSLPEFPEKAGMYFAGWYKDEALSTLWDFENDTVKEETTLYAKWSDSPILANSLTLSAKNDGLIAGDTLNIFAEVSPYYATNKELLWATGNADILTISDGLVKGITEGKTSVIVTAKDGSNVSASLNLSVYEPLLKPNLYIEKPVYKTTSPFTMQIASDNSEYVELYIECPNNAYMIHTINSKDLADENGLSVFYIYRSENSQTIPFLEGTYTAYVISYDALGNSKKSEPKTFWVTDSPALIARQLSNGYLVGGYNAPKDSKLMAAVYQNNRFVALYDINAFDTFQNIALSDTSGISVKFLWWDSLSEMDPVTDALDAGVFDAKNNGVTHISK